jgi:hypothetical protein
MIQDFSTENIDVVAEVLGAKTKRIGNMVRLEIESANSASRAAAEFHFNLDVNGNSMNVVSVYSHNTFMQLHNCNGFIASDLLNQVTFFGRSNDVISGLIIDREASCSFYANVSEHLLNCDFTTLPTEVMMCSIALSLTDTDTFDLDGFQFDE